MIRAGILISFLCSVSALLSQERADTIRLYYPIDATLPAGNFEALLIKLSPDADVPVRIRINAYADFLASAAYNKRLSERRALVARDFLLKNSRWSKVPAVAIYSFGEQFSQNSGMPEGEPAQRRVDVIFYYQTAGPEAKSRYKDRPSEQTKDEIRNNSKAKEQLTNGGQARLDDLKTVEKGTVIELEGLSFIPGKHNVMPGSVPVLEKLLEVMKTHESLKIEIQGHICCSANGEDGMDLETGTLNLSVNRAKAVYFYLVQNGIEASRLSYKGFGHSRPKVEERSPADEQKNRRVEIVVIERD